MDADQQQKDFLSSFFPTDMPMDSVDNQQALPLFHQSSSQSLMENQLNMDFVDNLISLQVESQQGLSAAAAAAMPTSPAVAPYNHQALEQQFKLQQLQQLQQLQNQIFQQQARLFLVFPACFYPNLTFAAVFFSGPNRLLSSAVELLLNQPQRLPSLGAKFLYHIVVYRLQVCTIIPRTFPLDSNAIIRLFC